MALIRQRKSGTWEIVIQRKGLLDKPYYASAPYKVEAEIYAAGVERLLDQGVLPTELAAVQAETGEVLRDWARRYMTSIPVALSDRDVLNSMWELLGAWSVSRLNLDWAEGWIAQMKALRLSPSTIRHKSGAVRQWDELLPPIGIIVPEG